MAETIILSPLLQVAFESLNSMIQDEFSLVWGVKQELEDLSSTLSAIKGVLEDANEKQVKDKSVRNWLKKLKDVAYEVDNILDEYATEALRWNAELTTESLHTQVSNFLSCVSFKKVVFRHRIGSEIREVNKRLGKIAEERSNYHLTEGVSERKVEIRETGSFVDEKTVLGRNGEREKIIDLLLSSDDDDGSDDVYVIPIVGMGGLGKTTLAQFVYNDKRVEKHFQLRMWVCVSEDFDIKRLIKVIVESGTQKTCEPLSLDTLQLRLREMLGGRRFLLVLDDVWNENQDEWEMMMHLLRGGGKGSRIMVTTRSEKVSSIMGMTPIHLDGLSEGDCWALFTQRAFGKRIEEVHRDLIVIGKEIVKKCKGVPLAAKTLGSLMHFKRDETEWLHVRDSETWDLGEEENDILNALRISYNHLPAHLKQCFAYCSIYPKDYNIEKEELIKLWMAQGFIQPSKGSSKEMEDIGADYFNDLLWRSFFQDVERDDAGNVRSCKMHDLLHDLARSIAHNECSIIQYGKSEIIANKVYHSSLVYDDDMEPSTIPEGLFKCKHLRTFLVLCPYYKIMDEIPIDLVLNLRCLRVLDLKNCQIAMLPDSIGNLKHLRYLNLRGNFIESLPETICNLCNLQTLNVENCHVLSKLPKDMKNMINLRHLEMYDFHPIDFIPGGIRRLTFLQTLPLYIVGKKNGFGLQELQDLNLRGVLRIKKLENAKNMEDTKKANLKRKKHLHTLKFCWNDGSKNNATKEEQVLEGLQPHKNLRSLSIENYGGATFPGWMRNLSLTNLVNISLANCSSCECLPPFGKLQFLKKLNIHGADRVKFLSDEPYGEGNTLGFPSLDKLSLDGMPNLEDWWRSGEGNLPCLRKLHIEDCPKLRTLPELPSLEKLRLDGMPNLEEWSICGEGNLSRLRKLYIENCPKLRALPQLPSLEYLHIENCVNIRSLANGLLQNLPTLQHLHIQDCPVLILPERIQHLAALEELCFSGFTDITSLPDLENLSSLKMLKISKCPELRSLPEGLKYLTALDCLQIEDCPHLRNRCGKGTGEDWHKIAHIRIKIIVSNYKLSDLVVHIPF